ncbi:MAG: pilus assembly protein [Acidobacteria bacterium]|nr:pilus assembly protein [Acidobacteriota bacterium]
MNRSGKLSRTRRGSVLVESSFAILPLLALMFGIIDIAFAIFVRNTMQFAVRQGVRYAVTSQTMTGLGQDDSIKAVVRTYSMGLLDGLSPDGDGSRHIAINYYDPIGLTLLAGAGSNVGGNIVVVSCNGLSWAWMVPLLRSTAPMQFSVSSADIMEATPLAGAPTR